MNSEEYQCMLRKAVPDNDTELLKAEGTMTAYKGFDGGMHLVSKDPAIYAMQRFEMALAEEERKLNALLEYSAALLSSRDEDADRLRAENRRLEAEVERMKRKAAKDAEAGEKAR